LERKKRNSAPNNRSDLALALDLPNTHALKLLWAVLYIISIALSFHFTCFSPALRLTIFVIPKNQIYCNSYRYVVVQFKFSQVFCSRPFVSICDFKVVFIFSVSIKIRKRVEKSDKIWTFKFFV
jgi:hypothetical protein